MGRNMQVWIEANIFVRQGKQNEVLLNFIKPLVKRLRSKFRITSFHFFHEPSNEVRFRVLTTQNKVGQIKELIKEAEKIEQVTVVKFPENPYQGEKQAFGEDGWKTAYKLFEAGSEMGLDFIDPNVRKGRQFNRLAFSHYLLNQSGLNTIQEANLHATASVERMFVMITASMEELAKKMTDKIMKLEDKIRALEEQQSSPTKS